jgi:hypothetical protein
MSVEQLEVKKENAVKAYAEADEKTKSLLANLFGKKAFVTDTTELIKTFADACEAEGIDADEFHNENEDLPADEYAYKQLKIIVKALNGGDVLDYKDASVNKYYPYFYSAGSGSGFSFDGYDCDGARSGVGSRLLLKTSTLATYAGKQFTAIYNQYLNG